MVRSVGAAELITVGPDGYPTATLLPILWQDDMVTAHMARANPHWRQITPDSPALLLCSGPQAYVSPNWYPSKAEHGKAVPTWNYTSVHLSGLARLNHDVDWLRAHVTQLVDRHESERHPRWSVTDAPSDYITAQLRAIVGLEFRVCRAEGKAKLSQNRSDDDRCGVIEGLRAEPSAEARAVADAVASVASG